MNFTRIILALTISYLLFMLFSSNANARERLDDVTIQIMDINDNIDDFINRIELPKPAHEKLPDEADTPDNREHVRPHVHANPADDQRQHEHPREELLPPDHPHDEAREQRHEHTHEAVVMDEKPAVEKTENIKPEQLEVHKEAVVEHQVPAREKVVEDSAEIRREMQDSRSHSGEIREDASRDAEEIKEKAREHAKSRDDD